MSSPSAPSATCNPDDFFSCGAGGALSSSGESIDTLLAAIAGSFGSFGIQLLIFLLLRLRLSRIYRPRSYLVPERDRVPAPPRGLIAWLGPLFNTPNLAFIQKCGLDAYFFLRFLRMLLKLFVPVALIVLPILLPINRYSGDGAEQGLNVLSISNVAPQYVRSRLWAHLIMALGIIVWFCYIVYKELRGYIRVRQAYLTSPQHRIRASATTVLVTGIPRKWLTLEALSGLYDVFPGGIKNIWINRNFDELSDKVDYRNKLAKSLEAAETNLVKLCRDKYEETEKAKAKKDGKGRSKKDKRQQDADENAAAEQMAHGDGTSAGDQHRTSHGVRDMLNEAEEQEERRVEQDNSEKQRLRDLRNPLGLANHGLGVVGHGLSALGKGVGAIGQKVVVDLDAGIAKTGGGLLNATDAANRGRGFADDDELFQEPEMVQTDGPTPPHALTHLPETSVTEPAGESLAMQERPKSAASKQSQPLAISRPATGQRPDSTSTSERTLGPTIGVTRPSVESKPQSNMQIELPPSHQTPIKTWQFWKNNDRSYAVPSPQPHTADDEEFPLNAVAVRPGAAKGPNKDEQVSDSKWTEKLQIWKKKEGEEESKVEYPSAINKECDEDQGEEAARWRQFIEPEERETTRLPIICPTWFPSLPLIGKKVDRVYWLRREVARLNLEIEMDQNDVERFPYMNSAFIQFNHQVAAHMACQSVSHHVPQYMAPRLVEISPDDVLWDNMSIKWWERYVRTGIVVAIAVGLIVLYAIPVGFTSLLSKIDLVAQDYPWLAWLESLPPVVISIIQGILPPVLLSLILTLVPIIFKVLVKLQGVPTGNSREMGVQNWYFAFLFIQVFLVVTLSGGLIALFSALAKNPGDVLQQLATELPKAANYFFSYLLVQALSNSASALLQVGSLFVWFILGPLLDSTPRAKWRRQVTLNNVEWGTFFPPFANFAVIGIIYSAIAPLILVFMIIIFGLFWIVYRYNVLYVYQFRNDTGGLLFPRTINQLFTGVYVMEICLTAYFFISRDQNDNAACVPQGVIMIVALLFTVVFQWVLNSAFDPLLQYLPITLEDEAVIRDEEFARAQASKFAPLREGEGETEDEESLQDVLEERERREQAADDAAEEMEEQEIRERRRSQHPSTSASPKAERKPSSNNPSTPTSPAWKTDRWRRTAPHAVERIRHLAKPHGHEPAANPETPPPPAKQDVEAQHTVGDVLYSGFADELEDLTPEERDLLVRFAFQHSALRAKRPVVWIPRDKLGVSDDEIRRAQRLSTVEVADGKGGTTAKTNIWMSNEGTALDAAGKVVFRRSPPDFSNVDLISL